MRVRLIAGKYGGRFIATPPSLSTHPMSERARGAIFNKLIGQLEQARVLDAFAGSGAIGIEALSRGASRVTFIEKDRVAAKIIAENCQSLGIDRDAYVVINTTVSNWLESSDADEFDFIFADPPYHKPQFSTVKRLIGLLKANGYMVLSHIGSGDVEINTGVVVDNRSYGNAHITFYRREDKA